MGKWKNKIAFLLLLLSLSLLLFQTENTLFANARPDLGTILVVNSTDFNHGFANDLGLIRNGITSANTSLVPNIIYNGSSTGAPTGDDQTQTNIVYVWDQDFGSFWSPIAGDTYEDSEVYATQKTPLSTALILLQFAPMGGSVDYYFRSDTYQTLGISAYGLDSDYTNDFQSSTVAYPLYYGFRVWLVSSANSSTELTSGTPEAQIHLFGSEVYGNYSGVWDCPETAVILGNQALKVVLYTSADNATWAAIANYITPLLITNQIEASTWTFTLNVQLDITNAIYTWGDSEHRSGISGIIFTEPLESEIQKWRLIDNLDLVGFVIGAYVDIIGEATYVLILLGIAAVFYFRYKHFGVIVFFFTLFGGAGGLAWVFVPPWAAVVTCTLIIIGGSFLVWKLIR